MQQNVGGAINHMIIILILTSGPGAEANPSRPLGPAAPYNEIT